MSKRANSWEPHCMWTLSYVKSGYARLVTAHTWLTRKLLRVKPRSVSHSQEPNLNWRGAAMHTNSTGGQARRSETEDSGTVVAVFATVGGGCGCSGVSKGTRPVASGSLERAITATSTPTIRRSSAPHCCSSGRHSRRRALHLHLQSLSNCDLAGIFVTLRHA